jgi:VWFA-related protein
LISHEKFELSVQIGERDIMLGKRKSVSIAVQPLVCFLAILLMAFAMTLAAQDQESAVPLPEGKSATNQLSDDTLSFGMNVDSVSLLLTARNKRGEYLSRLHAEDFVVIEDGAERPIQLFKEDTIPVNVVFLIDASYSVNDVLSNIADAAITYAARLRPDDRFSAVIFAHKPIKVLDWTNDVAAFQNSLKNIKTFGKTALYDSMQYAIENQFEHIQGKKGLVILTDGVDNSSRNSLSSVMKKAADQQITVYPIINSFPTSERYREMAKNERSRLSHVSKYFLAYIDAQNEFIDLVKRNGGRVIFSNGYSDLKGIYESLVDELKNQYALSFQPELNPLPDRNFREVTIRLRSKPGQVSIRLGYFQQ